MDGRDKQLKYEMLQTVYLIGDLIKQPLRSNNN